MNSRHSLGQLCLGTLGAALQMGCAMGQEPGDVSNSSFEVKTVEQRSALPGCYSNGWSMVFYVSETDKFYYCDGRRWQTVDMGGPGGGEGWLAVTAPADTVECTNGGVVLNLGVDHNENGTLDTTEVLSSDAICNGVDGQDGADGQDGVDGQDGADGKDGVDGQDGADGKDGVDGQDGTSCSVADNGDGTKTISCDDGTVATVSDGADGQNGVDGQDGAPGSSCSVADNGDGTMTMTCSDGTSVTWGGPTCDLGEYQGDAVIRTTQDLADLRGFTSITGNLDLNYPDVTSLDGLQCLSSVGGSLIISGSVVNIDGLSGMTDVGGHLVINSTAIESLEALSHVTMVGGNLFIGYNPALASLVGLRSLSDIGGALFVGGNDMISDLHGLDALVTVGADFTISENASLATCEAERLRDHVLAAPSGFIGGPITIANNSGTGVCE